MRFRAKVDGNHSEVVDAFRKCGASVQSLAELGRGVPDLLVAFAGRNYLVEVKRPKGKLTPDQIGFGLAWCAPIDIARSAEEAVGLVEVWRRNP